MLGLEAMAIVNQGPDKIESVFNNVSQPIERSLSDFDRSHGNSISKKQASNALKVIYRVMAPVERSCEKYKEFIDILSNGTDEGIAALDIQRSDIDKLNDQINQIDRGITRLLYTFFVAENNKAWLPHLTTLMTMKNHALNTFIEYKKLTMALATLGTQFLPLEYEEAEEFSDEELAAFKKSVEDSHKRLGMEPPVWKTA
ncbi:MULTISPECIES: hypothetical protein [Pectobacterium]|uniref:Uncharacterized protein n=1 Tax=Pectobacterium aquaticum TaxID=2204145 RepID=A0AA93DMG3_9GAMM|nr:MULTISPECIES: hypothetical protein [Pectobacterium]MDQ5892325.1 hypothetical protein [Pseudomonadota bacterium]PLY37062.1 hypothetical protein F164LOC_11405 [Pectobacterium carotovorum]AVT57369.1 hypothetical protein OA04_07260 [Pectobacterium versatile]MCH5051711.1 hypothetical protein [Pectobacterium aquaticum]RRN97039.1 hypothetical protein DMB79_009140 [Pectobacterium aquaticum]